MVGAGSLVLLDDFLRRGGPLGGALGFPLGALLLVPIGLTYARLVAALPDAGGEVAFTERVFPPGVGFVTGWFVVLAYLVVCPWEAVAIGKLARMVAPGSTPPSTSSAASPSSFPGSGGLALTAAIGYLNYRGIRFSAAFQNVCTFGLLAVFALFTALGLFTGGDSNMPPSSPIPARRGLALHRPRAPGRALLHDRLRIRGQVFGGGARRFRGRGLPRAILAAIAAGGIFYATVFLIVPFVYPWPELAFPFGTAVAFERAFSSRAIGDVILLGAVLSLFKVWNGCFVAATRLIYGMAARICSGARACTAFPDAPRRDRVRIRLDGARRVPRRRRARPHERGRRPGHRGGLAHGLCQLPEGRAGEVPSTRGRSRRPWVRSSPPACC